MTHALRLAAVVITTACTTAIGMTIMGVAHLDTRQVVGLAIISTAAGTVGAFAEHLARAFRSF